MSATPGGEERVSRGWTLIVTLCGLSLSPVYKGICGLAVSEKLGRPNNSRGGVAHHFGEAESVRWKYTMVLSQDT